MRCNGEYPLTDGRVNVRLTTNASQQVTSSSQPDAFGIGSVTAGTASAYAYGGAAGYREDGIAPAGLSSVYAFQKVGARYYDQAFGAFLTRDTDLSQSPYAYCNGDPVNESDPSGHLSAVNIASGGIQISGMENGSENAPVDTTSDPGGSTTGTLPSPSGGASVPDGSGSLIAVTPAGGGANVSDTQGPETTSASIDNRGNLNSIGESGAIPLGGVLAGLGATFSGSYNFGTGASSSSVGLTYSHGGFSGGFSTNGSGVMITGVYKGTF